MSLKQSLVGLLSNRTFQIVFLIYSSLLIFLGRQLDRGITNFDDSYYAQKAKEIFLSDSFWVVTWRGGTNFFDNPPLPFWLTGLAYKIFGVSGYAAIFSSAIFGTLTVYLTYALSNRLFKDNWISFLAAFVLLFPGMFVDSSRRGMLDITLAFFVTAAIYSFIKGLEDRRFYLVYGLMTGCAVLTKSLLGFFPVIIGFIFMYCYGGFKKIFDFGFLLGSIVAMLVGCSWYVINWNIFGDIFIAGHFKTVHMKIIQDNYSLFVLGYFKDMLKNYWPWLPVTTIGVFLFAQRGFKEKDYHSMILFLWVSIPFLVMSTSQNQTLRYLFMIFPALGIITAHTLAQWLNEDQKEKILPWIVGIIMATALVVNVTPIQLKVSLNYNSSEVRDIAPFVRVNTKPGERVSNFGFSPWNPTQALAFYSDRFLDYPENDPKVVIKKVNLNPEATWLTSVENFNQLKNKFPGELYLIYGNKKFSYFTSTKNRASIKYDFSSLELPVVR